MYATTRGRVKEISDVNVARIEQFVKSAKMAVHDPNEPVDVKAALEENLRRNAEFQERVVGTNEKISTLTNNEDINDICRHEFDAMQRSGVLAYQMEKRQQLPIFEHRNEIVRVIRENQVVMINGTTGSGKSTQVPQYILDDHMKNGSGSKCKILITQPRRISAITVAQQVARERGEDSSSMVRMDLEYQDELEEQGLIPPGGGGSGSAKVVRTVGFETQDAKLKARSYASMTYCTTGTVLVGHLSKLPLLNDISHVIIDEVHERQVDTDVLVKIMRILVERRSDIKVILMSASMDIVSFRRYFKNCPVINVPGKLHPVKEIYLEDLLDAVPPPEKEVNVGGIKLHGLGVSDDLEARQRRRCERYGTQKLSSIMRIEESKGDLDCKFIFGVIKMAHLNANTPIEEAFLVFLPGWDAIAKLQDMCEALHSVDVLLLHGDIPIAEQELVFQEPKPSCRKIVLSTNIAEVSVTIPDIVHVFDTGFVNTVKFLAATKSKELSPEWESESNAVQRSGRAGRMKPGFCYFLFTRQKREEFRPHMDPEIYRVPLWETALRIKMLGFGDIRRFLDGMPTVPKHYVVDSSIRRLIEIGALTEVGEQLTLLGFHLTNLPIEPPLAKLVLLGASLGFFDLAVSIAASLSEKKFFETNRKKEDAVRRIKAGFAAQSVSDHLMNANAIRAYEKSSQKDRFCADNLICQANIARVCRLKRILTRQVKNMRFLKGSGNPSNKAFNENQNSERLVKACVATALYPNIAALNVRIWNAGVRRFASFHSSNPHETKMFVHPKSINSNKPDGCFRTGLVTFYDYMKNRNGNIQMFDLSEFDFVLFMCLSHPFKSWKKDGYRVIDSNNFLRLDVKTSDKAVKMSELLKGFKEVFDKKMLHPSLGIARHAMLLDQIGG